METVEIDSQDGVDPGEARLQSPLFTGFDRDRRALLLRLHGPPQCAEAGTQLVQAKDPLAPLLTLSKGCAFRYCLLPDGRRQILGLALAGDTIGLDTLLTRDPAYAVEAATQVIYHRLPFQSALHLAQEAGWFRAHAAEARAREKEAGERALVRMLRCSAEEAVGSVLLDWYHRLADRGLAADYIFGLELTQEHLADFVGLTIAQLSDALDRLRSHGLIYVSGSQVELLEPAKLRLS